ncbi:MAG: hypothetical protein IPO90_04170 [Flavobacteriales bacterium]|nr:hypothetical protein [Flavobacteriales bacterium]
MSRPLENRKRSVAAPLSRHVITVHYKRLILAVALLRRPLDAKTSVLRKGLIPPVARLSGPLDGRKRSVAAPLSRHVITVHYKRLILAVALLRRPLDAKTSVLRRA